MNSALRSHNALMQLFSYTVLNRAKVVFASVCSVLNKVCDIVPEILIGISIDVIVNQEQSVIAHLGIINPTHQLYFVGGMTALFWIGESVFEYLYLITWRGLAQDIQHDLRLKTYDTIQKLDLAYFEDKKQGVLLSILQDDISQLEQFLSQGPNEIIQLTVNVVIMGIIFFWISPTLAFLTVLPIPFVVMIASYYQHALAHLYEAVRHKHAELSGHIAHRLTGIMTIKSYTTETYELDRLQAESSLYKEVHHHASMVNAQYIPVVRMAIMAGFIMSLVVGGISALQGMIPINWYAALVFLSQRFLWPFTTVTTITDMYERSLASAKRVLEILQAPSYIRGGNQSVGVSALQGAIQFNNVSFMYRNTVKLFDALNLTIPAKHMVAFVGSTGSGKSTIIKLLERFYDTTSGSILIDRYNSQSMPLRDLRASIGLVSQEVYLVDGTIAENIAYGTFGASRAAIIEAAKMAQAHDFIMSLPDTYDTKLQENGKNLSGGQRQRIAIARALVKKAPILVFDEATSAIDNETERALQQSMQALRLHHTIIIIAHRLSTVRNADTIYVLDKGTIVESGKHEELLSKNGAYARLWNAQFQQ